MQSLTVPFVDLDSNEEKIALFQSGQLDLRYLVKAGLLGGQTAIGGTAVTDILKLQGTSGNGTLTSPAIQALVGNNGATTALTILNNGNVGIDVTVPTQKLDVSGNINLNTNGTAILMSSYKGADSVGSNLFIGGGGQSSIGEAGATYKGSYNTAQGFQSLRSNTTGYYNSAQGYRALYSNTTGYSNSAQGVQALYSNTTGNYNSAQGVQAGRSIIDGNSNTFVGYAAGYHASQLTSASNSMALGNGAYTTASNQVVIGNTAITDIYANQNGTATIRAGKFQLSDLNTAPASKTATGTKGEIRVTADAIYVCSATDTWVKCNLATW